MSEILKNLKWNMVVTAVLVIILGLILILYPGIAVATICLIVGIVYRRCCFGCTVFGRTSREV